MGFASLPFLFLFLPGVFLIYVLIQQRYANFWLLAASLLFYALAAPGRLPLLAVVIVTAYLTGIGNHLIRKSWLRRLLSVFSICILILLLIYHKSARLFGFVPDFAAGFLFPEGEITAPLGASFFVLQAVMYIVDTCMGEEYLKDPADMALYLSFFPKLIAGPLLPYRQFRDMLGTEHRNPGTDTVLEGLRRLALGVCKKVLIADQLGHLAGTVFGAGSAGCPSVLQTWLGVAAYALQLYLDFAAYSDMAVGMGKLFGYELPENFRYPYAAGSLKEFWRRWHISLGRFFRDYVYIPLGGNRKGKARWAAGILAVWLLTGLWHGISLNFVIWGLAHGVLLLAENLILRKGPGKKIRKAFGHIYTILAVTLLWVVFRAEDLPSAGRILGWMFGAGGIQFSGSGFFFQLKNNAVVLAAGILLCIPVTALSGLKGKNWYRIAAAVLTVAGMIIAAAFMYMNTYQPFLYTMF